MIHHSSPAMVATKALLLGIVISFIGIGQVFAKPSDNARFKMPSATPTNMVSPTQQPSRPVSSFSTAKLGATQLQACQAHEQVIQTRMDNLTRMATTMLDTFNRISERVQTFYKDQVITTGKTVSNYDSLISDIQTKQTQVETDLTTTKNDADAFACTGIDPKGHLTQFRTDMQEVKTSLKKYRTSIKNLIVAVSGIAAETTPTP